MSEKVPDSDNYERGTQEHRTAEFRRGRSRRLAEGVLGMRFLHVETKKSLGPNYVKPRRNDETETGERNEEI